MKEHKDLIDALAFFAFVVFVEGDQFLCLDLEPLQQFAAFFSFLTMSCICCQSERIITNSFAPQDIIAACVVVLFSGDVVKSYMIKRPWHTTLEKVILTKLMQTRNNPFSI